MLKSSSIEGEVTMPFKIVRNDLTKMQVDITPGFKLPAKYIIYAVSPRYIDGYFGEEIRLRDCYKKSLALAAK